MAENLELFQNDLERSDSQVYRANKPLADRLRPSKWEDFEGLSDLDHHLLEQLKSGRGRPPSLVLWGPPGSGKTTLAKLIGNSFDCNFVEFSAVLGGVKEVREVIAQARRIPLMTILFVDEIHRFNKAQQDAFLPHVENGTIILIGATTENPSFYLNSALLSRARVVPLSSLGKKSLDKILGKAGEACEVKFSSEARDLLVSFVGGDARRLLNAVEGFLQAYRGSINSENVVSREQLQSFLEDAQTLFYDRDGEEHYNMASAFIKSMRGSDPDAALYWGFRMLGGGEDPRFLIRRMMIFASEDIGNADPRALQVAVATSDAFEKLGLPEGNIPLAQCITYLAGAPKSNRSYIAMHRARAVIEENPKVPVPLHLRNAPTKLMKDMGYGKDYHYPHDYEGAVARGETYLPEELGTQSFYEPSDRGYEKMIRERLAAVKKECK